MPARLLVLGTRNRKKVEELLPLLGAHGFELKSLAELAIFARNTESFARFCWDPYMHNPKLTHQLHRVRAPTLFVWGENDGIARPDYGRVRPDLRARPDPRRGTPDGSRSPAARGLPGQWHRRPGRTRRPARWRKPRC